MTIPSPYEKYTGVVQDPVRYETEIDQAVQVLNSFVSEFDAGQLPLATLAQVRSAADLLWNFAGCPAEDVSLVLFIDSPEAAASYRNLANVLPDFVRDITDLIEARRRRSAELPDSPKLNASSSAQVNSLKGTDDDIPF